MQCENCICELRIVNCTKKSMLIQLFIHRATDNWKTLKELEKAARVYRGAKDRLPPRVK